MEIMNLNENQVQIIDSLKTEFLRINETNKQHKVGKKEMRIEPSLRLMNQDARRSFIKR
jgi:hypothetical protein